MTELSITLSSFSDWLSIVQPNANFALFVIGLCFFAFGLTTEIAISCCHWCVKLESSWRDEFPFLSPASAISYFPKPGLPLPMFSNGSDTMSIFPKRRPAAVNPRSTAATGTRRARWPIIFSASSPMPTTS